VSGADRRTYRETEHKLRVHGLYRLPDLRTVPDAGVGAVAELGALVLTATYYDTPDLRLARSRITLRRREGGVDDGWHLKLPAGEDAKDTAKAVGHAAATVRDEVQLPLSAGSGGNQPPEPPGALLELVLAVTRGAAVEPVATLRTERLPRELRSADGRLLAELTDDTVSVLDGPHIAARFRELEVEARDGTPEEMAAVVAALVASGAVEGGLPAKAVRALGPAAMAPPDVPEPGPVDPAGPAGAAIRAHLARHTAAFVAQDLRVRRDLHDSVHQMRVAARRLRSGLKVFGPLVDAQWAGDLRVELAWIAAELGEVRDREVLERRLLSDLESLEAAAPPGSGNTSPPGTPSGVADVDRTERRDVAAAAAVVRRAFDAERAPAAAELREAMVCDRYLRLLDALVSAAREPVLTEAADRRCSQVLPPLLATAWHRLVRDARRLDPDGPDDSWHETRIAAKRARYAAEALVPVFGQPARKIAKRIEQVTELLGEHQDAVIAARTTRRLAAGRRVTGPTGFVLGLLHEYERASVARSRAEFVRVWPGLAGAVDPHRLGKG
jgi:inorganic triphosphatase YgiF